MPYAGKLLVTLQAAQLRVTLTGVGSHFRNEASSTSYNVQPSAVRCSVNLKYSHFILSWGDVWELRMFTGGGWPPACRGRVLQRGDTAAWPRCRGRSTAGRPPGGCRRPPGSCRRLTGGCRRLPPVSRPVGAAAGRAGRALAWPHPLTRGHQSDRSAGT